MYITKDAMKVSLEQFELMAHAIGFKRKRIKYNKYTAWRNYFQTSTKNIEWGQLVQMGFAVKREREHFGITYHVNENGLELFGQIYECTVIEGN